MAKKHSPNVRQKKFADYYIETGNAFQSAVDAGYSERYALGNSYKLVENSGIKAYIDERMKELEDKAIAKQEEVLKYLTSVMRGEETDEVLRGEGQGYQTIDDIEVSTKDRVKAAELLGKRYGLWTEKVEAEITVPTFINDLSEEDE